MGTHSGSEVLSISSISLSLLKVVFLKNKTHVNSYAMCIIGYPDFVSPNIILNIFTGHLIVFETAM